MQSWLLFPTDFYLIKVSSLSKNLCYVFDEHYVVLESKILIIKSEKFLLWRVTKVKTEVISNTIFSSLKLSCMWYIHVKNIMKACYLFGKAANNIVDYHDCKINRYWNSRG